jgi:hypothetical protein
MMHIIVLCTLLPYLHTRLVTKMKNSATADLFLGRGSVMFLTLGALGMGLAGTSSEIVFCMFWIFNCRKMLGFIQLP